MTLEVMIAATALLDSLAYILHGPPTGFAKKKKKMSI